MPGDQRKVCFSKSQAIALPQEAWFLVTENIGKAELRVTLCILFNYFEAGSEASPLSFNEIVAQTNMSKSTVLDGLNSAIERGSVFRKNSHNQPRYEPRFGKTEPMTCINHDRVVNDNSNSTDNGDTCHGSEKSEREQIFNCLVRFGVAYHVAHNMAMTNRYPLPNLINQILYIFFEVEKGLSPKGRAFFGWLVNRIKFNRFEPMGFDRPLAWLLYLKAATGKTLDEICLEYYNGQHEQITDLMYHEIYLKWLNNYLQNGVQHETE